MRGLLIAGMPRPIERGYSVANPTRTPKPAGKLTRPPIQRRDVSFDLEDEHAGLWHSDNPYISHFWNGLSLMFPEGERFFMRAVSRVRQQIRDPQLQADIAAFLSQEGAHRREHNKYNDTLGRQGYPVRILEWVTSSALRSTQMTSARWQLAVACAFEHLTATLADAVLSDPRILDGAAEEFAALWRWHCAEETEHKSVPFDVYETLSPGVIGYLRRVLVMTFVTANFLPYTMVNQILLASRDRVLINPREVAHALRFFWLQPGLIPRGLGLYLTYYRPGFKPWDHDNAHVVQRWQGGFEPELRRRPKGQRAVTRRPETPPIRAAE
jgi:predicted metal-dependent hydrolase